MRRRDPDRLKRLAATLSVAVAVLLTALKLVVAVVSGSAALLASAVDSLADIVASGITWLSIRIAQQPPDRRHRFGHGKAESLSALAQAAIVTGSALFVLVEAATRLVDPRPLGDGGLAILAMLVAIGATLLLLAFQGWVVRVTGSQAIAADALHYRSDLSSNLAVVVSLLVVEKAGLTWVDPLVATLVAGWLLWGAFGIGRTAVHTLMDHELPADRRNRIAEIVRAHPEVVSLHDLRTREAAGTVFIEFHIELDGEMTVRAAHVVTDALEAELRAVFPDAEIIIHQEPAGLEDMRLDHRIQARAGRA
jgi:ferrous-iron efflux pump FieF